MRRSDPRFAVNARWTAVSPRLGWAHFRIVDRRWRDKTLGVELMAVCDRSARLWIEARDLLDQTRFVSGWRDLPAAARSDDGI